MNKLSELNDFSDIDNAYLRAYNRVVLTSNLQERGRLQESSDYISQFEDKDKEMMMVVVSNIKTEGWKAVKMKVQAGINSTLIDVNAQEEAA